MQWMRGRLEGRLTMDVPAVAACAAAAKRAVALLIAPSSFQAQ